MNFRKNSTFDSTSRIEIATTNESTTMNETFDTFDTQIIETLKISNYAILQRELNQLNKKRQQTQLFREMQKIKTIKIVEFLDKTFIIITNRILINEFQKKKKTF
jgi:tyrosine-protein phosphatase YwqE